MKPFKTYIHATVTPQEVDAISAKAKAINAQLEQYSRKFDFTTLEFPIGIYVKKFITGDIVIPAYQRGFVWTEKEQIQFIESVLLGVPLPAIFLKENEETGILEVIDGSQRIRTLSKFFNNQLEFKEMEALTELNGLKYEDLPLIQRRRFLNRTLKAFKVKDTVSDKDVKEIFKRINARDKSLEDLIKDL